MESNESTTTNPKHTLSEFINENDKILTAIGVLIALAAFFITLPMKSLAAFLAFVSLLATLPLFWELFTKQRSPRTWVNLVFANIFFLLATRLFWYVLIAFREQWKTQMANVVFWSIVLPSWHLYDAYLRGLLKRHLSKLTSKVDRWAGWYLIGWRSTIKKGMEGICNWRRYAREGPREERSARRRLAREKIAFLSGLIRGYRDSYDKDLEDAATRNKRSSRYATNAIFIFVLVVSVSKIETPVADVLNYWLDDIAEKYKIEEGGGTPPLEKQVPPVEN